MLCQMQQHQAYTTHRNDIANVEQLKTKTNKNRALAFENVRNTIFHVSLNRIK